MQGQLQRRSSTDPLPTMGALHLHRRGWVLLPITMRGFKVRTWRVDSVPDYRICSLFHGIKIAPMLIISLVLVVATASTAKLRVKGPIPWKIPLRSTKPACHQCGRLTPLDLTGFEQDSWHLRRDPSPAYIDPRVGRPPMQARPPLPFQYVTGPPMPTHTHPTSWETPGADVHMRGQGPVSTAARYVTKHFIYCN